MWYVIQLAIMGGIGYWANFVVDWGKDDPPSGMAIWLFSYGIAYVVTLLGSAMIDGIKSLVRRKHKVAVPVADHFGVDLDLGGLSRRDLGAVESSKRRRH